MQTKYGFLALACALGFAGSALAQNQGITKTELKIATIQDLSGPIAAIGKQARDDGASDSDKTELFSGTARRVYGLDRTTPEVPA